jgi:hypothetical protein
MGDIKQSDQSLFNHDSGQNYEEQVLKQKSVDLRQNRMQV